MILLLDTSTPICRVALYEDEFYAREWQADRNLANGLLKFIKDELGTHKKTFDDIKGICVYKGPGSFTGLRIGLTVMNTLADTMKIPIVGETGENWKMSGIERLKDSKNDRIITPHYGSEATITTQRK